MDDGRQPATKQDLLDLESRLEARLEARFTEVLRETETKLLTAFYSFAQATQKHLGDLDRSDFSIRERLDEFNRWRTEVEKRLNMPGA